MKKKYRIKAESINGDKALNKICHTSNISHLIALLGTNGYMVQEYYEITGDNENNIKQVDCARRKAS